MDFLNHHPTPETVESHVQTPPPVRNEFEPAEITPTVTFLLLLNQTIPYPTLPLTEGERPRLKRNFLYK